MTVLTETRKSYLSLSVEVPKSDTLLHYGFCAGSLFILLCTSGRSLFLILSAFLSMYSFMILFIRLNLSVSTLGIQFGAKSLSAESIPRLSSESLYMSLLSFLSRLLVISFDRHHRPQYELTDYILIIADLGSVVVVSALIYYQHKLCIDQETEWSEIWRMSIFSTFLLSLIFRAPITTVWTDTLWCFSALLGPLSLLPQLVLWVSTKSENDYPLSCSLAQLTSAVSCLLYWIYLTESHKRLFHEMGPIVIFFQGVGCIGCATLATLTLKNELRSKKSRLLPLLVTTIKKM